MQKRLEFTVFILGFTALSSQIIFLRELLLVFYGNELSISIILGLWLVSVSIGSGLIARLKFIINKGILSFTFCQFLISLILPLSILFIRFIRQLFNLQAGEISGVPLLILGATLVVLPFCLLNGLLFVIACSLFPKDSSGSSRVIGKVYILEAIGASVGGLLVSFLFIRIFTSFQIALILGVLNSLCVNILSGKRKIIYAASLVMSIVILFSPLRSRLEKLSLSWQWRGYTVLATGDSIYGNVTVARRGEQHSLFTQGLLNFSYPDRLSAEETVHFSLLEHNSPKSILLIGGGLGAVEEILKHKIEQLDYVELDPLVIKLGRENLPKQAQLVFNDKRLKVYNIDGRYFVKTHLPMLKLRQAGINTDKGMQISTDKKNKYDVVIISLPHPFSAQVNRFYTVEFFKELKAIINPDGIISFGIVSSENYISGSLQKLLGCLEKSLREVFSDVIFIPGDYGYFLASDQKDNLSYDYSLLMQRLKARNIPAKYVREYYLFSKLSPERIDYAQRRIQEGSNKAGINSDFYPLGYLYDTVFWLTQFQSRLVKFFDFFSPFKLWSGLCVIIFLALIFIRRRTKAVFFCLGTTGFAEIVFQIVVILSFQVIYGYLFHKLGLILTSFMVGLVLGAGFINKKIENIKNPYRLFISTQIAICIYPLILPVAFGLLAGSGSALLDWWGSQVVFPVLPIIAGFIGGVQFPLANRIYILSGKPTTRSAGLSYAVDLLGSCVGAFLVGPLAIPILGIFRFCLFVSLLNLGGLVLLIKNNQENCRV